MQSITEYHLFLCVLAAFVIILRTFGSPQFRKFCWRVGLNLSVLSGLFTFPRSLKTTRCCMILLGALFSFVWKRTSGFHFKQVAFFIHLKFCASCTATDDSIPSEPTASKLWFAFVFQRHFELFFFCFPVRESSPPVFLCFLFLFMVLPRVRGNERG